MYSFPCPKITTDSIPFASDTMHMLRLLQAVRHHQAATARFRDPDTGSGGRNHSAHEPRPARFDKRTDDSAECLSAASYPASRESRRGQKPILSSAKSF